MACLTDRGSSGLDNGELPVAMKFVRVANELRLFGRRSAAASA